MMKKPLGAKSDAPEDLIDARIAELGGWRGETLSRIRAIARAAGLVEEWKWNIPVWSHHGIVCTGEAYKAVIKTTFAKGAFLDDPSRLFNSSLEGNVRRAIDFREGDELDERALTALFRAAAALNAAGKTAPSGGGRASAKKAPPKSAAAKKAPPKRAAAKKASPKSRAPK
jgi:hypothetical protein